MEKKKVYILKSVLTAIFALLILGAYGYSLLKGEPWDGQYLYYGAICACLLFSAIFIGKSSKKALITLALAVNVAADYFLILSPSEDNNLIAVCVFLGAQFVFLIYTLTILKTNIARALNVGLRIALGLAAYLILPRYFTLSTLQILAVIYLGNSLVTLITLACKMNREWLTFLSYLFLFVCELYILFANGGVEILGITGGFADIISKYNIALYYYVPGLFLLSCASVWESKRD